MGLKKKQRNDFQCHRCAQCCRLDGYVRLRAGEVERIAQHLGLSPDEVRGRFVTNMEWGEGEVEVLIDHEGTTDCVMLDKEFRCVVHKVKPQQCRTFPYRWKRTGANSFCAGLRALKDREDHS